MDASARAGRLPPWFHLRHGLRDRRDGAGGCAVAMAQTQARQPLTGARNDMNNLVRDLRGERGWSQADLAQKLDVSRQTVNAIETGKYDPSLPLAFKIARLFGMP